MSSKYEVVIGLKVSDSSVPWVSASQVRDKVAELLRGETPEVGLDATLLATAVEIEHVEYRDASDDATAQLAENAAQKRYNDDIRGVVEEFIEMAKDGDFDDEDAAETWLHETVDGHSRVIYTAKAQECLCLSSNDDAFVEEFGSTEGAVTKEGINWSTLAFSAFRADINELLDAHDVDPNDPDTWGRETEIDPDEDAYGVGDLEDLETISTSQTCDLKMENSTYRVWLSRCTVADGEPYDNKITVEELCNGCWVTICEYEG
jgi:hypothetical protein